MQTFLEKIATHLITEFAGRMDEVCVVLPNRRAGLFLKKNLSGLAGKTIWSPEIFSIEDFIFSVSEFSEIDPVLLQLELFQVHQEIEGTAAQELDDFLKWGTSLINDFNEVDMYLADPDEIFNYLSDAKAISLWNPDNQPLTPFEEKYLKFYRSLGKYYHRLKEKLFGKKSVYQGLAYRWVAESIKSGPINLKWDKIIFAGFNALTRSEEQIIFTLGEFGKSQVFWDTDKYYMNDKTQEAGLFLRSYKEKYKNSFLWEGDNFSAGKKIKVIGIPKNVGQVKVAGQILEELSKGGLNSSETAVVLNDETLLIPLLNSIPKVIEDFNLTMGLPLRETPCYRFIDDIFVLQENARKFSRNDLKRIRFYFRDIIRILEHPYSDKILKRGDSVNGPGEWLKKIKASNKIFFTPQELEGEYFEGKSEVVEKFKGLFKYWDDKSGNGLKTILIMLDLLKSSLITENKETNANRNDAKLHLEYVYRFAVVFKKLSNLISAYPEIKKTSDLYLLFEQIARSFTMPFYGEPLKGLQIMGMLETRVLDFKNIIMLSVNEDLIPSGKNINSFIPVEIKRYFKLPTYHDRNAVFAYHFYRLLQRSENVYLLYNTESDQLGGGEKSRFISQIEHELPRYNPNINISEKVLHIDVETEPENDIIKIEKDPGIIEKLIQFAESGFSASAVNTYRNCSLQFYFKYLLGLSETEDIEESIEAGTLGTIIHDVFQAFYQPFEGKTLEVDKLSERKNKIGDLVRQSFLRNYAGGEIEYGKNRLIVEVAHQFVNNFIIHEIKELKNRKSNNEYLTITGLEKKFKVPFEFQINGQKIQINLKGIIDRIDRVGNIPRIIDYKTGKVEPSDLNLKDWESLKTERKLDKCYQLLHYTYIYIHSQPDTKEKLFPGIFSMRNLGKGFMALKVPENDLLDKEILLNFEKVLNEILAEIFNLDIPFEQTPIIDNCKYCPFISICNR
jgi:hypothetical protein